MSNSLLKCAVSQHWRSALLCVSVAGLSACVAEPTGSSSSSQETVSSQVVVASSSEVIVASSSVAPSSSSVASSSMPPSSSSVASSSSVMTSGCSDAAFCDDFESVSVGGAPDSAWAVDAAGSLVVTDEKSYSGNNSIKVKSVGQKYNRNYMTLDLSSLGSAQEQLYGRMMVWVDDPGGAGGDFTFVQAEGAPKSGQVNQPPAGTNVMYRYRVDAFTTNGNLMANYDTWVDANDDGQTEWATDCGKKSNSQLPRGKWSCVEWNFDAASDELRYWLNGTELTEMAIDGSGGNCLSNRQNGEWTAPAKFERLLLGIEQYQNGVPERTLYIDDVKVDSQYIGCPDMAVANISSSQAAASSSAMGSTSSAPSNGGAVIFQDDFESDSLGATPSKWNFFSNYTKQQNPSTNEFVVVSDSASGSKALKVTGDQNAPRFLAKELPAGLTQLYMRAYIKPSNSIGNTPNVNHSHIFALHRDAYNPNDREFRFGEVKKGIGFGTSQPDDLAPSGQALSEQSTKIIPSGQWSCVEVGIHTNGDDKATAWLNGEILIEVSASTTWQNGAGNEFIHGALNLALFGWQGWSAGANTIIYDDIVISKERIGCN